MALPNELILDICGYLPKPDLKACRLVSKSWSASASVYLFSKIYISPREEDIEVFNLISQNGQLSRCVRTLEYDGTNFSNRTRASKDEYIKILSNQVIHYPKLYLTCLGDKDTELTQFIKSCLKMPNTIQKDFRNFNFISEGYREWEDHNKRQRRILMNGEFIKILICGLGKLELLNSVKITSDWPTCDLRDEHLTRDRTYPYFYGSPFGRAWQLSHPKPCRRFSTAESFNIITTALSQSQRQLRSLRVFRLPISVFNPNQNGILKNSSISAYSSLEHLVLVFNCPYQEAHVEPSLPVIQALLGSMGRLRSLQLSMASVRGFRGPPSDMHWKVFLADGTQWIALTKLILFGFVVSVKNLCHLLKIRMPNLRELSFREVELLEGRWEGVIEFLKTSMRLLSFPLQDYWRNYHQRGEIFPEGLLAERLAMGKDIENYVVNGGRHPCLCADEDDSASTRYLSDLDL